MKNITLAIFLISCIFISSNDSMAQNESYTFNVKLNKGNIKEIISQTWAIKIKPYVNQQLRSMLDNNGFDHIHINIPDPVINCTAGSLTISFTDFNFHCRYPIDYLPDAYLDGNFDLAFTANFGINTTTYQFVLNNVQGEAENVHLDIDGCGGLYDWLLSDEAFDTELTNRIIDNLIEPKFNNNIVLSSAMVSANFPGTTSALTVSLGQPTDIDPYINIPVTVTFTYGGIGHEEQKTTADNGLPQDFTLEQNYPNPFNPTTTIRYALKEDVKVSLKIYNTLGQEVRTLVNEDQSAGFKEIMWDGKNNTGNVVPTGVYMYRIVAGNYVKSQKMMMVK
jgi:hypothetical protein